ncbi:MAG: hypothetical protein LBS57_04250 [Treponema sp.]|jgi:hypothetical protein|nr:hypothetical protein [Treponema sp.]
MENSKPLLVFTVLFMIGVLSLMAFGSTEAAGPKDEKPEKAKAPPKTVRVTGRVRLVGNGPRTEIVITGANGEWVTTRQDRDKLMFLQHRTVTVEGKLDYQEMKLANGKRLGRRLILRDITIIEQPQ